MKRCSPDPDEDDSVETKLFARGQILGAVEVIRENIYSDIEGWDFFQNPFLKELSRLDSHIEIIELLNNFFRKFKRLLKTICGYSSRYNINNLRDLFPDEEQFNSYMNRLN